MSLPAGSSIAGGGGAVTINPPVPLPTGAATEATLSSIDTELATQGGALGSIDSSTSTLAGTVSGTEIQADVLHGDYRRRFARGQSEHRRGVRQVNGF